MMGFRIAFFKVHYPLQYYSAYFYRRSQKDAFDAALMVKGEDVVRRKINEIQNKKDATARRATCSPRWRRCTSSTAAASTSRP